MTTKAQTQERDHIDRFLESIRERLPMLDPEVEGIVDRIGGLHRRFRRAMDETLAEFRLDWVEYKLLGLLSREGEVYRSSPGRLGTARGRPFRRWRSAAGFGSRSRGGRFVLPGPAGLLGQDTGVPGQGRRRRALDRGLDRSPVRGPARELRRAQSVEAATARPA